MAARTTPASPGTGEQNTPGLCVHPAREQSIAAGKAARQLAEEGDLPLDAVRIGHLDGDYHDPRCAWQRHRQIASDGAILIRPDRFIAWRHQAAASDPRAVLAAALSQILRRRPFAQAGRGRLLTGAGAAQR